MIVQTALGREKQLYRFLRRWWYAKDAEIDAWFTYKFDPKHMFLLLEDDQIVSCLQYATRTLRYRGKNATASVIELALTAQDQRDQGYFKQLLSAFCAKASCNDLVSLVKTMTPKIFRGESLEPVAFIKEDTLPVSRIEEQRFARTRKYRPAFDLYPLYQKFIRHFDGSIVLTRAQFENELAYLHAARKKIDIMYDDHYEPNGLAIYTVHEHVIRIECLIYLNSDALESLFSNLSLISDKIYVRTSEHERLEKLYPNLKWRKKETVLARANNPKLFATFSQAEQNQAFKDLDRPMWFGLL